MNLIKQANGSYLPVYESDIKASHKIPVGSEVKATRHRNPMFSRKVHALIDLAFENQEKYDDREIFRQVVTIKAGYYTLGVDVDGSKRAFAKSWSFDNMGEDEFEQMFHAMKEVIKKEIGITDNDIEEQITNHY